MFNYLLRSAGLVLAGCAVGMGISEGFIIAKSAKKLREAAEDLKTLDAIKEAAKKRVEEIKKDPREIIFPLYSGFVGGMAWACGNWTGWHKGWKQGVFDGIREGILGLERQWIGKCPKEFRKFIDIIMKNGFPDEVEVFRQKTGPKTDDYRWWGWSPKRLLNDWEGLENDVKEQEAAS